MIPCANDSIASLYIYSYEINDLMITISDTSALCIIVPVHLYNHCIKYVCSWKLATGHCMHGISHPMGEGVRQLYLGLDSPSHSLCHLQVVNPKNLPNYYYCTCS